MNIQPYLTPFYDHLKTERQLSGHTVAAYRSDLAVYEHVFRSFSLTTQRQMIRDLSNREYAARTLARKCAALRAFYGFVQEEGVCLDPLLPLPSQGAACMMPTHVPSTADIEQLFAALDPTTRHYLRDRALLEILYGAGLRISECVHLTCQSVQVAKQWLLVMGKGRKQRRVPLHTSACSSIQAYLNHYRGEQTPYTPESPLFLAPSGLAYTRQALYGIVKKYLTKSGRSDAFTPHSLRHAFATHLIDQQVGTLEVQQLLGHASIRSTQHYISVQKNALKNAYRAHWQARRSS